MEQTKPRTAYPIGRDDDGIHNCCAALRRVMERMKTEPNFFGRIVVEVTYQNSRPQSYRSSLLIPAPT